MEALVEIMAIGSITNFFSFAFSVTMYVLGALGIYTIAKRRGIRNPWLAWLPIGNAWILGSISDQYQFSVKQKKTGRRKVLMGLEIAMAAVAVFAVIVIVVMMIQAVVQFGYEEEYYYYNFASAYGASDYSQGVATVLNMMLAVMGLMLLVLVINVVYLVFYYICFYDLYTSCNPDNATLFLVLSILFSFLSSIFAFVCRNKDAGMRPQPPKGNPYQYPPQGYQPQAYPGYQAPGGQGGYYPPSPEQPAPMYYPPGYRPPAPPVPPVQPAPESEPPAATPEQPAPEPEQPTEEENT